MKVLAVNHNLYAPQIIPVWPRNLQVFLCPKGIAARPGAFFSGLSPDPAKRLIDLLFINRAIRRIYG